MQNARGHHAVPPYVVRATPTATVSTPLAWKEVNPRLDPKKFTIAALLKRLDRSKTELAPPAA
jgi:bifunctional non-homologous end joining protein LigD